MDLGCTLMGEQRAPLDLVRDAVPAEETGFDLLVASDHVHPWLEELQSFADAGCTRVALVQVGPAQEAFCAWAASTLLPAARARFGD